MTNFDKIKKNLTVSMLANLTVKTVIISTKETFYRDADQHHVKPLNGDVELGYNAYYQDSEGMLYPYNTDGYKNAIEHEISYLNRDVD